MKMNNILDIIGKIWYKYYTSFESVVFFYCIGNQRFLHIQKG